MDCVDAGLDSYAERRWCSKAAAQQVCGARAETCYGRCQVNSDLNFTVECDPNGLARCVCDTFNTTFFTGVEGKACDRDYVVRRLATRDNVTQWCGILGESGTVRCRDVNDSRTCYQADACLCQFDAGDGTPLGYVGLQTGTAVNGSALLINNATLNVTTPRRPVFAHCAYVYSAGNASNLTEGTNIVSSTTLYRGRKLPWLRREVQEGSDNSTANLTVVLIDNRPVLTNVPTTQLGFSCDYQQKCGTFTEAAITYCDSATRRCNVTCGCYRGATTMVGTDTPCSAFVQSCDNKQRARCAQLKNVPFVSYCLAACDELNKYCEPLIGTCVVADPVVVPRFTECSQSEASRYCAPGFTTSACKRKVTCTADPPRPDCFVCDCARQPGYIADPTLTYNHQCTNLRDEYTNCTATEATACGLRGVLGCRKRLVLGGRYATLTRYSYGYLFDTARSYPPDAATVRQQIGQPPVLDSGLYGGLWMQECICLSDLFNTLDTRIVVNSAAYNTSLRCDAQLTSYLTQRGACPFRADTGMPCNGAGACIGGSNPSTENLTWPNGELQGKGVTWLTHFQRWRLAVDTGVVWLYVNATAYDTCTDAWCNNAPITGRVARQVFPANQWATSNKYGSIKGTPMRCFSTGPSYKKTLCACDQIPGILDGRPLCGSTAPLQPCYWEQGPDATVPSEANCNIQMCTSPQTIGAPRGAYNRPVSRVDVFGDYVMSGTTWASAESRLRAYYTRARVGGTTEHNAATEPSPSLASVNLPSVKVWENCVLRTRSKEVISGCYSDPPRSPYSTAPVSYGPHNVFMLPYGPAPGETAAQRCMPRSASDVEYVTACHEMAQEDFTRARNLWEDSNTCVVPRYESTGGACSCHGHWVYAQRECGCPVGQYRHMDGYCKACQVKPCCPLYNSGCYACGFWDQYVFPSDSMWLGTYLYSYESCDIFRPSARTPGWVSPSRQFGPPQFSNNVFSTFTTTITATEWYTRIGRYYQDVNLYNNRLDPAAELRVTLPVNGPTSGIRTNQWVSGCIAHGNRLARRTSTTQHINECVSWSVKYSLVDNTVSTTDRTRYEVKAELQPRQYSELYCYTAKTTDNMFMWHGINNEYEYAGDPNALTSQIGPAFAKVFDNLPNKCTSCAFAFSGDNCDNQLIQSGTYSGFDGLCAARGTCCGVNTKCTVPADWDGRTGCINGVFDFPSHRCVCDPGWRTNRPNGNDPGPGGYCNFNACAADPNLAVFTKAFPNSTNPVCNGRGTCLGPQGVCRCNSTDWGGKRCELNRFTACPGGSLANRVECSGHGECVISSNSTAACVCTNHTGAGGYWTGAACDVPHTPDDATCLLNAKVCPAGQSTCAAPEGGTYADGSVAVHPLRDVPYCACPTLNGVPIKGGQFCEYSRCPIANGKVCNGQGTCVINGTNAAGYPSFGCRKPLDINLLCAPLDTQCIQTTVAPLVCNSNLDYDGCACEVPIRVYCAASSDQPLCSQTSGSLLDQLNSCKVLTDIANGTVVASCTCPSGKEGAFCQASVCGDCGTGTCNADTRQCVCRRSDLAINGLWEGSHCNVSVTAQCGFALVSGGDVYKCSGHGQCIEVLPGQWGCDCDTGYTGAKCELSDCPAPCDERSECLLPVGGGSQKECICKHPLVWSRNTTYPNLCNVDSCKQQNPRYRPNANGTQCECIEAGVSFASGCTRAPCPVDPVTGDVCGQPNPSSSCREGDCVVSTCQVSYDYTLVGGRWNIVGDSRRRLLCDRFQKQCEANATCICGLGYSQDPVTGLCTRICDPDHTLDIIPCINTLDPLCIDAPFHKSLQGYDNVFR